MIQQGTNYGLFHFPVAHYKYNWARLGRNLNLLKEEELSLPSTTPGCPPIHSGMRMSILRKKTPTKDEKKPAPSSVFSSCTVSSLGLDPALCDQLRERLGFETPTQVQAQSIPVILSGRHVYPFLLPYLLVYSCPHILDLGIYEFFDWRIID